MNIVNLAGFTELINKPEFSETEKYGLKDDAFKQIKELQRTNMLFKDRVKTLIQQWYTKAADDAAKAAADAAEPPGEATSGQGNVVATGTGGRLRRTLRKKRGRKTVNKRGRKTVNKR